MVLIRRNDLPPIMEDSSLLFIDSYITSLLNTTDDGREYQCETVINSVPSVSATNSITLDVMSRFC